jgi:hypothetical protein
MAASRRSTVYGEKLVEHRSTVLPNWWLGSFLASR